MSAMHADYANPVTLCTVSGGATGLQPAILDIETVRDNVSGYPPVLQIIISGAATVVVYGALQVSQANPATMIDPIDVSAGGFTASDFYDLIPGIRFYQVNVTANNATVTVKAGSGQLLRMTNNAPQGT